MHFFFPKVRNLENLVSIYLKAARGQAKRYQTRPEK